MTEQTSYRQDILFGLQRAWLSLYEAAALSEGEVKSEVKNTFLHQLTDCLCWDSIHDLQVMEKTLATLTRLAAEYRVKGQIRYWLERLRTLLNELLLTLNPDKVK